MPYPGGPAIEEAARTGDPESIRFPRAWLEDTWDFSFSGLKTAVLREVRKYQPALAAGIDPPAPGLPIPNLAASFQAAVVDVLAQKTVRAAREFAAKEILVAGGVSANQELRTALQKIAPCPVRTPPLELCTDNAAMVAAAGFFRFQAGVRSQTEHGRQPGFGTGGRAVLTSPTPQSRGRSQWVDPPLDRSCDP